MIAISPLLICQDLHYMRRLLYPESMIPVTPSFLGHRMSRFVGFPWLNKSHNFSYLLSNTIMIEFIAIIPNCPICDRSDSTCFYALIFKFRW
ncbi:hypothetical protein ES332_D07G126900v1 [Gossypium tomentosum]|uniref:Uncharacterized protein n=1 Tax=Gossypium tomentosum TaxID=34277 RepID=A0A5D2K6K8_GOSTO|nr:hypothetical protein ES332_D07G126900v1 [Gossypium tomentosum]